MAADYSFEREPEALYRSVLPECLEGILGAGGRETAGRGPLERGNAYLIELYQDDEGE